MQAVEASAFRAAMSRLAGSVHIVTTDGQAGRSGLAATAVCSVTDTPSTLLVCAKTTGSATSALVENGVFCVNTLTSAQKDVARRFGGKNSMAERFMIGDWYPSKCTGTPVLSQTLASFECEIESFTQKGTHLVIFGQVVSVLVPPESAPACVYFDRNFHELPC